MVVENKTSPRGGSGKKNRLELVQKPLVENKTLVEKKIKYLFALNTTICTFTSH